MSVLTVGGVALPEPAYKGYTAIWQELNKADRNTLGNLIKERIATKYTISVEWHAMTSAQKNTIISATDPNTFTVQFLSMMDNQYRTGRFYRGSDLEITGYGKMTGATFQYYDIKMSLVEV